MIYGLHNDGDDPEIVARRCGVVRGRLRSDRTDCVGDLLGDSPIAPIPVTLAPCPTLSLSIIAIFAPTKETKTHMFVKTLTLTRFFIFLPIPPMTFASMLLLYNLRNIQREPPCQRRIVSRGLLFI